MVRNLKGQLNDDFYKEFTMKHRDFIEKTNIYKILKKMPKGANLHLHVDTAFDLDWVKKHHNFCFLNNLVVFENSLSSQRLHQIGKWKNLL